MNTNISTKIKLASLLLASFITISIHAQALFEVLEKSPGNYFLKVSSSSIMSDPPGDQLKVFVDLIEGSSTQLPPILGEYEIQDRTLSFFPLVKFKAGQAYKAVFQSKDSFRFIIPQDKKALIPQLLDIFPSAGRIPENLLKFYLYFDTPMAEGQAYSKIHLYKKDGSLVEKPFLQLQPELWNKDQTRLTLWLDPGRVKRDLVPNQKMGPPLLATHDYILKISKEWESTEGIPLEKEVTKEFSTYAADRDSPKISNWQLDLPDDKSLEPLIIHFQESMDYALLQNCIRVFNKNEEVIGKITISKGEKSWVLHPQSPWTKGDYRIEVLAKLEDLAANNLNRPFDRDVNKTEIKEQEYYILEFIIK